MITQASGKLDEAEAAFTESYTHARLIEQKGLMSRALLGLAEVARMRGDVARATTLAEEALAIGITWDIPTILTLLGHLARALLCGRAAALYHPTELPRDWAGA
jgi:hypothetical protein